jgi:hypothetical protein
VTALLLDTQGHQQCVDLDIESACDAMLFGGGWGVVRRMHVGSQHNFTFKGGV